MPSNTLSLSNWYALLHSTLTSLCPHVLQQTKYLGTSPMQLGSHLQSQIALVIPSVDPGALPTRTLLETQAEGAL